MNKAAKVLGIVVLGIVVLGLSLVACQDETETVVESAPAQTAAPVPPVVTKEPDAKSEEAKTAGTALPSDAIAVVGEEVVTERDLRRNLLMTIPERLRGAALRDSRDAMVEALVRRKAMSQLAVQDLEALELAEIEAVAKAYREQLLANALLHKKGTSTAITDRDVQAYYDQHPEEWAGPVSASFEMFWVDENLSGEKKLQASRRLDVLAAQDDWKSVLKRGGSQVQGLRYWSGKARLDSLEKGLGTLVSAMKTGETSRPSAVDGRLYLVRVAERSQADPVPLAEVRDKIRKTLKSERLKTALKELGEVYKTRVPVRYLSNTVSLTTEQTE